MKQMTCNFDAATFIVRLWRDPQAPPGADPPRRGTAVHVQSGTERSIQNLDGLADFMQDWLTPRAAPADDEG